MKTKKMPLLWNSGTSAPDSVHLDGGLDLRLSWAEFVACPKAFKVGG